VHRLVLIVILLLLCTTPPALARDWFRPAHGGVPFANPDLTPSRALAGPVPSRWDGQLVLWEGRVMRHDLQEVLDHLLLATDAGTVSVRFRRRARNLDYDRSGFRVAVKGHLEIRGGRVAGLDGRSVILLGPPEVWDYPRWLACRQPTMASFVSWRIGFHNPESSTQQCDAVAAGLVRAAGENGLDPLLLASLVQIESAWDADAVSSSGALGLGHLMPFTATGLGVDAADPLQNLAGAARMLGGLLRAWDHLEDPRPAALAAYNAGPNRVRRTGGRVPAIPETTNYVFFIGYVHRDMARVARGHQVPAT